MKKQLFIVVAILLSLAPRVCWATGFAYNTSSITATGVLTGDGSGLTGISGVLASSITYPFMTTPNPVSVYESSVSIGNDTSNGLPTFYWRAASGKLVLGCNSGVSIANGGSGGGGNGECGGFGPAGSINSEGIAISKPSVNAVGRAKADGFYIAQADDSGKKQWSVDNAGMFYQNNRSTSSSAAFKIFELVGTSSSTIIKGVFQYQDTAATYGAGKVLTSNASGVASWSSSPSGFAVLSGTQTFTGVNSYTGCVSALLMNRSGMVLSSGTLVKVSPNYDFSVTTTSVNDIMPVGAIQDIGGCADGAVCSVGVQGSCLVRMHTTGACTRGYFLGTSGDEIGTAQCLTGIIPTGTHNQEVGHALQRGAAGSVIEGMLHFN